MGDGTVVMLGGGTARGVVDGKRRWVGCGVVDNKWRWLGCVAVGDGGLGERGGSTWFERLLNVTIVALGGVMRDGVAMIVGVAVIVVVAVGVAKGATLEAVGVTDGVGRTGVPDASGVAVARSGVGLLVAEGLVGKFGGVLVATFSLGVGVCSLRKARCCTTVASVASTTGIEP